MCVILVQCILFQNLSITDRLPEKSKPAGLSELGEGFMPCGHTVRPEPHGLAVVGKVARPLQNLCGVLYGDVLRQGETVFVGTDVRGSRRLPFKIM